MNDAGAFTLREQLVYGLVPGRLNWWLRARKAWKRKRNVYLRQLPEFVDPERASVDVGANRGVFTYYLARLTPKVYAYEPHPKMHRILARLAKHPKVVLRPVALAAETGDATLAIPKRADGGLSNQRATLREALVPDPGAKCQVETRRLDDEDLDPIGFLKIDVEGCELDVLRGAQETIRTHRPALLIEIDERWSPHSIEESLAFVQDLGYEGVFFSQGERRTLDSFDPDRDHRDPANAVRNFFFVPRG